MLAHTHDNTNIHLLRPKLCSAEAPYHQNFPKNCHTTSSGCRGGSSCSSSSTHARAHLHILTLTHIHTCACACRPAHAHKWVRTCARMRACAHTHTTPATCIRTHTHKLAHSHTQCTRTGAHVCTHTCTHARMHPRTHTHAHARACRCGNHFSAPLMHLRHVPADAVRPRARARACACARARAEGHSGKGRKCSVVPLRPQQHLDTLTCHDTSTP
jgi:hypothetical protein